MMKKEKKQALLIAAALALLLIAGLALLRDPRDATSTYTSPPQRTTPNDSVQAAAHEPWSWPVLDSSAATSTSDSFALTPMHTFIDSATRFQPETPAAGNDTLRRYGSHATTMQMLIELLEEKQLLMEDKVELSRRLEIAEILDSALITQKAANNLATTTNDSSFSSQLDSLMLRVPAVPVDSTQRESLFPPRP